MKAYLLDTHIWIWSLVDAKRLSGKISSILQDQNSELFLSPISVWEAVLLCEKKRISIVLPPTQWVRIALEKSPVTEAPLNHEIALGSRELATHHKDPADRFILATARVFQLTLITADSELWKVKGVDCVKG